MGQLMTDFLEDVNIGTGLQLANQPLGSTLVFACSAGFKLYDNVTYTCGRDGNFTAPVNTACMAPAVDAFPGSGLITVQMATWITSWLAEAGEVVANGWAMCYDSLNGDDKSDPAAFHSQCDQ